MSQDYNLSKTDLINILRVLNKPEVAAVCGKIKNLLIALLSIRLAQHLHEEKILREVFKHHQVVEETIRYNEKDLILPHNEEVIKFIKLFSQKFYEVFIKNTIIQHPVIFTAVILFCYRAFFIECIKNLVYFLKNIFKK